MPGLDLKSLSLQDWESERIIWIFVGEQLHIWEVDSACCIYRCFWRCFICLSSGGLGSLLECCMVCGNDDARHAKWRMAAVMNGSMDLLQPVIYEKNLCRKAIIRPFDFTATREIPKCIPSNFQRLCETMKNTKLFLRTRQWKTEKWSCPDGLPRRISTRRCSRPLAQYENRV